MATTSYSDQVKNNYECGSFNEALKSGNPEQEALTNMVMFALERLKAEESSAFDDHVSQPTLQEYLDRLSCGGQDSQLSNAEAWYIMGQIELTYIEAAA
jgi:hypothetical protein